MPWHPIRGVKALTIIYETSITFDSATGAIYITWTNIQGMHARLQMVLQQLKAHGMHMRRWNSSIVTYLHGTINIWWCTFWHKQCPINGFHYFCYFLRPYHSIALQMLHHFFVPIDTTSGPESLLGNIKQYWDKMQHTGPSYDLSQNEQKIKKQYQIY